MIVSNMLSRVFAALLTIGFSLSGLAAGGGDDVGNGGGLAEKNFFIALQGLETYSNYCLQLESCRLTAYEKSVLTDILKAVPEERKLPNILQFESGTKKPGFFVIDGELKVAKTGFQIGSTVYINTDLIYYRGHFGEVEAVSLPMAVAILVHEFGHHVSIASHSQLDLIGVKVSSFLQNRIQTTPFLPWTQTIMATFIQPPDTKSFPQILLTVGKSVKDISREFRAAINCPKFVMPIPVLPFPDLQFGRQRPLGTLFHNIHWERETRNNVGGSFVIVGALTNACDSGASKLLAVNSFVARIAFSVSKDSKGRPVLNENSISIEQSYEPWYKFILFPRSW